MIKIDFKGKEITWGTDTTMEKLAHEGKHAIVFHSKNHSRHDFVKFASEEIRDGEARRVEKILGEKRITKIWN